MNRQALSAMWEQFRGVNGVTLRALERIPEDKLAASPIPNMRSTAELVDHLYGYLRAIPQAVVTGRLTAEDVAPRLDRMATRKDMIAFARECFRQADEATAKITDAHLGRKVDTHWGVQFPGAMMMSVLYDEHLHHRGQLYAYLRALGAEPPFIWSFEENEPAFRPRAAGA